MEKAKEVDTKTVEVGGIEFEYVAARAIIDRNSEPIVYGDDYLAEYEKRSKLDMSWRLAKIRKAYAEAFSRRNAKILDFGCGFAPIIQEDESGNWYGHDINPAVRDVIGSRFDPEPDIRDYGCICFFDALEHLPWPENVIGKVRSTTAIVINIPLWNGWSDLDKLEGWKHWKPKEHFLYVSTSGLIEYMDKLGCKLVDSNSIETSLGREDAGTFCFRKR